MNMSSPRRASPSVITSGHRCSTWWIPRPQVNFYLSLDMVRGQKDCRAYILAFRRANGYGSVAGLCPGLPPLSLSPTITACAQRYTICRASDTYEAFSTAID